MERFLHHRFQTDRNFYLLLAFVTGVASLTLGYLLKQPSLRSNDDMIYIFSRYSYSDIPHLFSIWYGTGHPLPYIQNPSLEYPVVIGWLTYLLSFRRELISYFNYTYAVLSLAALATIWFLFRYGCSSSSSRRMQSLSSSYFGSFISSSPKACWPIHYCATSNTPWFCVASPYSFF